MIAVSPALLFSASRLSIPLSTPLQLLSYKPWGRGSPTYRHSTALCYRHVGTPLELLVHPLQSIVLSNAWPTNRVTLTSSILQSVFFTQQNCRDLLRLWLYARVGKLSLRKELVVYGLALWVCLLSGFVVLHYLLCVILTSFASSILASSV